MLFGYGNNVRNAVNDKSDRYIITCRNDYYAGAVIERNLFLAESASYVHNGGSIGVLVKLDTELDADKVAYIGKDVAMQVAAANPGYLNETEVPAEVLEKEKEILKVQAINEGKPEAIAEKMVQGRIKKFYKENCLMDQEFIKDGDQTIKSYTEAKAKELGGKIEILSFVRYEKGEGIEKRNDDFASEVASMMK